MIHNSLTALDSDLFILNAASLPVEVQIVVDELSERLQISSKRGDGRTLFAFLTGQIGIRSLERDLSSLTMAETRVLMQFRKLYTTAVTRFGKGAAKHPTRIFVYENFNSSQSMVVVFPGWTTIGDRRTSSLSGLGKAGVSWELVPLKFVDFLANVCDKRASA